MSSDYATLCGVTQQELEHSFNTAIEQLANQEQLSKPEILAKIKYWYNGYQFHYCAVGVYNPYSLLSLFKFREFNHYWFTTATPTFLLDLLQNNQYDLKNLTAQQVGPTAFEASDPQNIEIQPVLVQTGYLTIKQYNPPLYQLDFPNYEVKKSFYDSVTAYYAKFGPSVGESYNFQLIQHLQTGQIEAEVRTNEGRIDCVIQTNDKNYALKYQNANKPIVLLGGGV